MVKASELRELDQEELLRILKELKEKLFELRTKKVLGSIEKPTEIRKFKRDIARVKTILREKFGKNY
ncbi:MAG: 50S ribosomal protein L29 [Candidatus Hydrothermales bacterium]